MWLGGANKALACRPGEPDEEAIGPSNRSLPTLATPTACDQACCSPAAVVTLLPTATFRAPAATAAFAAESEERDAAARRWGQAAAVRACGETLVARRVAGPAQLAALPLEDDWGLFSRWRGPGSAAAWQTGSGGGRARGRRLPSPLAGPVARRWAQPAASQHSTCQPPWEAIGSCRSATAAAQCIS